MKNLIILFFSLVVTGFASIAQSNSNVLISSDELLDRFDQYIVIDVSEPDQFQENAIIGAKNIWRPQFTQESGSIGGMMASKEQMETLMGHLGITPEAKIAVYDHKGGSDASRLWWIMTYYGHPNIQLLNGGLNAWGDNNTRLDSIVNNTDSAQYLFAATGENDLRYVELAEMKAALDDPNTVIIDTRSIEEYEGSVQKDGAFKKGRIPGSIHIDWAANIDYQGDKTMLSNEELLKLYESKGVTKDKNILIYCHSGSRSSLTGLVLTQLLGYENVGNYDGSWIEWSSHADLPIETGAYVQEVEEQEASYGEVFWSGFKNFGMYTWNEITFQVTPWYVNYFWWLIVLSLFVWGLEIIFPWRKDQPIFRKDFWVDAFFMFFNFYIFKLVIFMSFSEVSAKFFHDVIGGDATSYALIDMSGLALWVQLLIFFIATDFIQWFTHVLLHRFTFLWRFHKVHHSIEQMGFAGHLRFHWMENVFYTPMKYITVMLIGGFTPEMAYVVFYISIAIGHLNHANIGLSYGPLKYIFNNPKMHIWHHAKELPEDRRYGVNFGISLSLWDYLFRKNYIPYEGRDIPLGFDGMERYPKSFFGLIFSGFKKTPDEL